MNILDIYYPKGRKWEKIGEIYGDMSDLELIEELNRGGKIARPKGTSFCVLPDDIKSRRNG